MNDTIKKDRNSIFELVKVICIFGIIVHHYVIHGVSGVGLRNDLFDLKQIFLDFLCLGSLCTSIFVMCSGFFLYNSKKINIGKVLLIVLCSVFYSLLSFSLQSIFEQSFSIVGFFKSFFSLFIGQNWFVLCYLILYILHPFLNRIIQNIEQKAKVFFILFLFTMSSILSFIPSFIVYLNDLISLICVYFFGAFLKSIESDPRLFSKKIGLLLLLLGFFLMFSSSISIRFLGQKIDYLFGMQLYFYSKNSIFVIMISTGIIILCSLIKPKKWSFINIVSESSLGIYLISDNPWIRTQIWKMAKIDICFNSKLFFIHLFATCLLVFLLCFCIDFVRHLFEKIIFKKMKIVFCVDDRVMD